MNNSRITIETRCRWDLDGLRTLLHTLGATYTEEPIRFLWLEMGRKFTVDSMPGLTEAIDEWITLQQFHEAW